jgi:hypothetical protein
VPRPAVVAAGKPMADNGLMRARLRGLLDGAGWSVGVAVVLFVFALVAAALVAQSPEAVLWTGHRAVGTETDGLVVFRYQGRNYSAPVPGSGSAKAVTVYFDPGNPDDAMADTPIHRLTSGLLVGVPLAAGVTVLVMGLTRKQRWARRQRRQQRRGRAEFGTGLDDEFVARHLQERRDTARRPDGS